jgi:two-component system chemotaxis response regulator CheY
MANILIVDDDPTIRELIRDILAGLGHAFAMADSGARALEMISKTHFDLVILDRNMPSMGGLVVLRNLRLNPATAKLKVLFCTAAEMLAEVDEAFAAGANDYIVKPLDFTKLKAKVANLTRRG